MFKYAALTAALLASAAPAWAQRTDENAVERAEDAFGTSAGDEAIGLYGPADVRGFSPITAGNVRIDGLAVTDHGGFTRRIFVGSTVRVGLTAQGYQFPAPTGIVDYALRTAGDAAIFSPVVRLGPLSSAGVDLDVTLPIAGDRLGFVGGFSYEYEENTPGEDGRNMQFGGLLRWRPSDRIELKTFYGRLEYEDDKDTGAIFVAGPYLPPRIERRYFGPPWLDSTYGRQFFGATGTARVTNNWTLRAGAFRWESFGDRNMNELYRNVQSDGSAQRSVVATKDQFTVSHSGDLRSSFALEEGGRRHTFHLAARARDTRRTYGGSDIVDLGPARIGAFVPVAEPAFAFGPQSHDRIRQLTGGFGYELRWPGVGELSIGLQKADYEKSSDIPGRTRLVTTDSPWLYNSTLAIYLTPRLAAYAGYTRGLEESGSAPSNAINRNDAPPALRTSQRDAGLRYAITPKMNLVAGVFDVRKPYFNLDSDRLYRELGIVRHRGVELSLAGQPLPGLSLIAGAVLLDARVSGEAVELGVIGPRPVGTTARTVRANLDYRLPFHEALSVDIGIVEQAGEVASAQTYAVLGDRQLMTEQRTTVNLGARYRFRLGKVPATLRAQVTNLLDIYRWDVSSNAAFGFNAPRKVQLTLAADF